MTNPASNSGTLIDLPKVADRTHLEEIQDKFVSDILTVFRTANFWVLIALTIAAIIDEINIAAFHTQYADRLINHQVIMALIGSTTVQVGAIAVTIANHLFKSR